MLCCRLIATAATAATAMFAVPFVMPCCAVLCYPCCAVLCRAMLCHAMSCCAVLCYAMLSLLYVLYCDCYVMLCYAMLSLPCFVQRKAMTPEDRRNNIIQLAHFAWNVSHLCYSVDRACLCCKLSRLHHTESGCVVQGALQGDLVSKNKVEANVRYEADLYSQPHASTWSFKCKRADELCQTAIDAQLYFVLTSICCIKHSFIFVVDTAV